VVGGGLHLLGRVGDGVADASRLGRAGDAAGEAGVGARGLGGLDDARTIATSAEGHPAAIALGMGSLSARQGRILEALPSAGARTIVPKRAISSRDLAALTAATGDEFAMLTNGSRRMIVRGNPSMTPVDVAEAAELGAAGWRLSAHTHPGVDLAVLVRSDGDINILRALGQRRSLVLNSRGAWDVFDSVK
jgi:hypothetical protein